MSISDLSLVRRWTAARIRLTLRNKRAFFITLIFPLVLVLLFNSLNGHNHVTSNSGTRETFAQFYTPAIGVFSLVAACYTTLVMTLAQARDAGLLKRVRGTPLPMPIYLGAWMVGGALVGIAGVTLMFVVSVPAFGVHIYASTLPAAIVTIVLGAACLSALGLAVASLVRTADQATAVAQITFLPLSFISGIWFPLNGAPEWLLHLARIFPLYHIADAFEACFTPGTPNHGWNGNDLVSILVWTAVGLFVAARRFQFEPGVEGERRRRGFSLSRA